MEVPCWWSCLLDGGVWPFTSKQSPAAGGEAERQTHVPDLWHEKGIPDMDSLSPRTITRYSGLTIYRTSLCLSHLLGLWPGSSEEIFRRGNPASWRYIYTSHWYSGCPDTSCNGSL